MILKSKLKKNNNNNSINKNKNRKVKMHSKFLLEVMVHQWKSLQLDLIIYSTQQIVFIMIQ